MSDTVTRFRNRNHIVDRAHDLAMQIRMIRVKLRSLEESAKAEKFDHLAHDLDRAADQMVTTIDTLEALV